MTVFVLWAVLSGCGRKLPPLPPEIVDPVEITRITAEGGEVDVLVRCGTAGKVVLAGKPVGSCPMCTDDLEVKDERPLDGPGEVLLVDRNPGEGDMVYRIILTSGRRTWKSPPRIVTGAHGRSRDMKEGGSEE